MAELREELQTIGLDGVETYINSGNIFFESAGSKAELVDLLGHFFCDHYPFIQSFSLFSAEDYAQELAALPAWWQEDLARKECSLLHRRPRSGCCLGAGLFFFAR